MDGIQAAVLSVKLPYLTQATVRRQTLATFYDSYLKGLPGVILPFAAPDRTHVYHVYAVRVPRRDEVARGLADRGIATGIHYPTPIHLTEAYRSLGYGPGAFPVAERLAKEFLSLPMYPELTIEQLKIVTYGLEAVL